MTKCFETPSTVCQEKASNSEKCVNWKNVWTLGTVYTIKSTTWKSIFCNNGYSQIKIAFAKTKRFIAILHVANIDYRKVPVGIITVAEICSKKGLLRNCWLSVKDLVYMVTGTFAEGLLKKAFWQLVFLQLFIHNRYFYNW